jgi:hypothetical protein
VTHRSRLCQVIVDVPPADYERETDFWSAALGREPHRPTSYPEYAEFGEITPGILFDVQSVGESTPRVHLDLETDDVEAEVARLAALGATELSRPDVWVVMQDPAGTVFCVVPVQVRASFEAHATTWE